MYIVILRFAENRAAAAQHMDAHQQWIMDGMADGVFLMVGSIHDKQGGCVLADGDSLESIQQRVNADPFVQHKVVSAEILKINPVLADKRLNFLLPPVE